MAYGGSQRQRPKSMRELTGWISAVRIDRGDTEVCRSRSEGVHLLPECGRREGKGKIKNESQRL